MASWLAVRPIRQLLRRVRLSRQRLRCWLWIQRGRLELRRHGGRLVVEAPHGVRFVTPPRWQVTPQRLSAAVRTPGTCVTTVRIGPGVDLGDRTTIEVRPDGENLLVLEDHVYFLAGVRVTLFDGEIVVGGETRVRDNSLLKSAGRLTIGRRSSVGFGAMLHCAQRIELQDMVGIAERVSLLDSDHLIDGSDVYNQELPTAADPIVVERNALVGANAVILRGVTIGRNTVVAAGSVVRAGTYPAGWVVAGVPARALKALPAAPPA